jgi:Family of unknown function (DUF5329)
MIRLRRLCFGLPALLLAGAGWQFAHATPSADEQKVIDTLIARVSKMNSIRFMRNGTEHTGADAAQHLQSKFDHFKDRIVTAEDFIKLCATRSEMTGERYQVKDAKGALHNSDEFMKQELRIVRQELKRGAARG